MPYSSMCSNLTTPDYSVSTKCHSTARHTIFDTDKKFCVGKCPSGWAGDANGGLCTTPANMLTLNLNKKVTTASPSFDGANSNTFEPTSAVKPAYNMGQYFSGSSTSIAPSSGKFLSLHHSFTISAWVRPDVDNEDMAIFSVTVQKTVNTAGTTSEFFTFGIASDKKIAVW